MSQALLNKPMREYSPFEWALARKEARRMQAELNGRNQKQ